ncbi:HlyD family secretion protein [Candidatus Paracaedibacter symbiosus]|uniref:HlyD family secretion protein n=1 Tax=Candidatus Paracaedibacter symbiosus TaxID=244582 RepID=UPI000509FB2B|nr:HlyD family secretion protein [Candidatus Paracaedibacter symbiosus]
MPLSHEIKKRLVLIVLGVITLGLLYWFFFIRGMESTDDAYLKGNMTIISPKVAGYVTDVLIEDNQHVKKGDVIAKIDQRDFKAQLDGAQAEAESLKARLTTLENQHLAQEETIKEAQAGVNAAKATLVRAEKEFKRTTSLIKDGAISEQLNDQAVSDHKNAVASVQRSQAIYEAATIQLKVITAQMSEAKAQSKKAEAAIDLAQIDLQNTIIVAPKDGLIGNRGVQVGQLARPGLSLVYLIPDNEIWVEANFKETQIGNMKPGQKVKITIDSFSGVTFQGKVDSLAPASGSEFSILPPENATGNFTKIVRRIPVKICFQEGTDLSILKPGMSSIVHVRTS